LISISPLHERIEFIDRLEAEGRVVATKSNFTDCRVIKDNKFLNLAFDGKAACIVTGDNDLLVLNPFRTIRILSPSAFLNEFEISV
jgi:putative PIN family toxin of toxin-antitoxin system